MHLLFFSKNPHTHHTGKMITSKGAFIKFNKSQKGKFVIIFFSDPLHTFKLPLPINFEIRTHTTLMSTNQYWAWHIAWNPQSTGFV